MSQPSSLMTHIVDLWHARRPATQDQMLRAAEELRGIDLGFNIQAMDLSPNEPENFGLTIIRKTAGVRNLLGPTGPLITTLGAHPDKDFTQREVLPHYVSAKTSGQVQISSVGHRILDRIAAYDRLILPVKSPRRSIDHALAIIHMKWNLPAGSATQPLDAEERRVLSLLSQGIAIPEIARQSGLMLERMDHIADVIRVKLGARTLTHAIAIAVARDFVATGTNRHRSHDSRSNGLPLKLFDEVGEGIILTDRIGRIVYLNDAAETIIAGDGLKMRNGRLVALHGSDTAALQELIVRCGEGKPADSLCYLRISRGSKRSALSLLAKQASPAILLEGGFVMISIVDPDNVVPPSLAQLQAQFNLTRTEAQVAQDMVNGLGVQNTATRLGIGPGTIKTHLLRIFAKTNTSRQAQLARLLLSLRHVCAKV